MKLAEKLLGLFEDLDSQIESQKALVKKLSDKIIAFNQKHHDKLTSTKIQKNGNKTPIRHTRDMLVADYDIANDKLKKLRYQKKKLNKNEEIKDDLYKPKKKKK